MLQPAYQDDGFWLQTRYPLHHPMHLLPTRPA